MDREFTRDTYTKFASNWYESDDTEPLLAKWKKNMNENGYYEV